MDYVVTKKLNNKEWRIYFSEEARSSGKLIYKGNKLLLDINHISEILEYRIERSTGTYFFADYGKFETRPNIRDKEQWFSGKDPIELIKKSWETLDEKLHKLNPNMKKILISENFI